MMRSMRLSSRLERWTASRWRARERAGKKGKRKKDSRSRTANVVNSAKRELAYRIDAHETACPECYNREPLNLKPRLPHHPWTVAGPRFHRWNYSCYSPLSCRTGIADTLPRKRTDRYRRRECPDPSYNNSRAFPSVVLAMPSPAMHLRNLIYNLNISFATFCRLIVIARE